MAIRSAVVAVFVLTSLATCAKKSTTPVYDECMRDNRGRLDAAKAAQETQTFVNISIQCYEKAKEAGE